MKHVLTDLNEQFAKEMKTVFCIDESIYESHITKGKAYEVLDITKVEYVIKGDHGRKVSILKNCFTNSYKKVKKVDKIIFQDEIQSETSDCVEVRIKLSNDEIRWCVFATPKWIQVYFENSLHIRKTWEDGIQVNQICYYHSEIPIKNRFNIKMMNMSNLIIVERLSKEIIERAIHQLDKQNELMRSSLQMKE